MTDPAPPMISRRSGRAWKSYAASAPALRPLRIAGIADGPRPYAVSIKSGLSARLGSHHASGAYTRKICLTPSSRSISQPRQWWAASVACPATAGSPGPSA